MQYNLFYHPRILHLTLSKQPFDVMLTGEKTIEYRCPTEWIKSRIENKYYDYVKFTNGYGSDKPYFIAKYLFYDYEQIPNVYKYSNGLEVRTTKSTIKIYLGEIIERCNIK